MSRSSKTERVLRSLVEEFTDNFSISRTKSNHYKIQVFGPKGNSKIVIASCTASDHRTLQNLRSDLRRSIANL